MLFLPEINRYMTKTKSSRTVTIADDLWERIKQMAGKENRTVSNYVETILLKHFEEVQKK